MNFTPKSLMPHTAWPAISGDISAQLMAILYQFELSQSWSPKQIETAQFKQLQGLLRHAATHSAFYSERFQQVDLNWSSDLGPRVWSQLPIINRTQLQAAGESAMCKVLPDYHQVISRSSTSGSSGQPLNVTKTNVSQMFWQAVTFRDHLWHKRDLEAKLAIIRAPRNAKTRMLVTQSDTWGPPAAYLVDTGPSLFINIEQDIERQWQALMTFQPQYLLTYPTNLLALVRFSEEKGQKLTQLSQVRTFGEIATDELRQLCREVWGVSLVDNYSCQEVGNIALQCPKHEHLHVQSETVKVEVLKEDNTPCKVGETGRVIVTNLHNFASPIIRYDTGDHATVGGHCDCGINLPVLKAVKGRSRNMMKRPDGALVWPNLKASEFYQISGLRRFQVIQTALDTLQFVYFAAPNFGDVQLQQCEAVLRQRLQFELRIEFVRLANMPSTQGGKQEDFKCEI